MDIFANSSFDNSNLDNSNREQIVKVFQSEIECAQNLLQSLELEYAALAEYHTEALEEVVRVKQERIQQLELISAQREKLLATYKGAGAVKNNGQSHSYDFGPDGQLTSLWNKLVDTAETCREKNRINGSIVELVSKQSRHALDILHGILPESSSSSELYNSVGQTTNPVNKRSLVQV